MNDSQDRDLEKQADMPLPRHDLLRLLESLDQSIKLLSHAVQSSSSGGVTGAPRNVLPQDSDNEADALTATSSNQDPLRQAQPLTDKQQETLEQWWTNSLLEADSAIGKPHSWQPPVLSRTAARRRRPKLLSYFEKWLMDYCSSALFNPIPFMSLILDRLEDDPNEPEDAKDEAKLEAEADELLATLSIVTAALELACSHRKHDGLRNLTLGEILRCCYRRGYLARPAGADDPELARHFHRVAEALCLVNIWTTPGDDTPRLRSPSPNALQVADVFQPAPSQPSILLHHHPEDYDVFTRSNLSIKSLVAFGGIKVIWTEFLSEHLTFDVETHKLRLYWLSGTAQAKWLNGGYLDMDDMHLRRTYALLFPIEPSGSKAAYRAYWRLPPPYWICRYYSQRCSAASGCTTWGQLKAWFPRVTQSGEDIWSHIGPSRHRDLPFENTQLFDSFGIYADRLRALDAHMARWKPRGLRALWLDRRDSYQWWTLWAVIVIGSFALFVSLVELGVSTAQMVASFKAIPGQ